jgi:ribosomal protein S18 acetylase RimI-like enzyme
MDEISIVNREMTSEEKKLTNIGFDELYIEEGIEIESSERFSFVAIKGKALIGCSSGLAYKNGENYSGWFHLTDLFVDKAYRSKGLGTNLLKEIENHISKLGIKYVYLWTSGDKALRFYYRHAYVKFTEMENWYSDGSSRVGLRKDFLQD